MHLCMFSSVIGSSLCGSSVTTITLSAKDNHDAFMEQVKAEMADTFVDGENYAYVILKDGAHMYKSWVVDLYNSLLVFFH